MKTKKIKTEDLLKNKDYADAFHNYFWLLGQGKKSWANDYKKIMNRIEKELAQ